MSFSMTFEVTPILFTRFVVVFKEVKYGCTLSAISQCTPKYEQSLEFTKIIKYIYSIKFTI